MEDQKEEQGYSEPEAVESSEVSQALPEPAIPSWLKMLEEQSYQAELLISGLVVAGLFQLPDLIINFMEGFLLRSNEIGFYYLSVTTFLMLAATNALLFFFAFHFLFRSIWVALLGLNSVYPDGIKVDSEMGSGPAYWRKAKEKYPNLSAYNLELDSQCSVIFSFAIQVIIVMSGISLLVIAVYLLFDWLMGYFQIIGEYALEIGIALYLMFMFFSIVTQMLARKYPESKRVNRLVDAYQGVVGNIFALYVFRKPLNYISGILVSNARSASFFFVLMLAGFLLGLVGGIQTGDRPIFRYLKPDRYLSFNDRPEYAFPFNYGNLIDSEQLLFSPVIESDRISGSFCKLFIPIIEREKPQSGVRELSLREKFKYDRATRDSIRRNNLLRYADFHAIYLNDSLYQGLDFQYYDHPQADDEGLLVYVPTNALRVGRNVLQIRKQYYLDDKQKIVTISFYYEPQPR